MLKVCMQSSLDITNQSGYFELPTEDCWFPQTGVNLFRIQMQKEEIGNKNLHHGDT